MKRRFPRKLTPEQNAELRLAQNMLARDKWTFAEYSQHLSAFVYSVQ